MRQRVGEAAVLSVGIVLRLLLPWTYDVKDGFDYWFHAPYVEWFIKNDSLPPITLVREVFHPPLFYWLGGLGMRLGATHQTLLWLSALSGVIRLLLIFIGLRVLFPTRPLVRLVALFVAALLPSALQIDGILNAESLHATLATAALLLMVLGLRAQGRAKWGWALAAGVVVGLALMAKVTGAMMAAVLGIAGLLDLISAPSWRERFLRAAPWTVALALTVAVAGGYYQRNQRLWGVRFPNSFNTTEVWKAQKTNQIPISQRRPLDFYWAWQASYFTHPYELEDKEAKVRFWPTLIASSFLDYYNYRFVPAPGPNQPSVKANWRTLRPWAYWSSRVSYVGGLVIALAVVIAAFVVLWRHRDPVWLLGLITPLLAVMALMYFALKFPFDDYGVIKGNYCQFAAAPLYVLTGVAFEWLWRRRTAALALALALALLAMAQYTLYARLLALYLKLG